VVFDTEASFEQSYIALQRNTAIYKITALSSGSFYETPDLENFATAYRSSKRVINLARQRWTLSTCDVRQLVYDSDRQALSGA